MQSLANCLALVAALLLCSQQVHGYNTVCYMDSSAYSRPGKGSFEVEDLDPSLCTHAVYGFVGVNTDNWSVLGDAYDYCDDPDSEEGCGFKRFIDLKRVNPNMSALLGVGGYDEDRSFSLDMASRTDGSQILFAENLASYLEAFEFDGADIDLQSIYWENRHDLSDIAELLAVIADRFNIYGFTLSATLPGNKVFFTNPGELVKIGYVVEMLNIAAYDYPRHEEVTHHHTPLCSADETEGVVNTINNWSNLVNNEKMNLGIAAFGRCYELNNLIRHGVGAPAPALSPPGEYTETAGFLGYNEICLRVRPGECQKEYDNELQAHYMWCRDKVWCGYDDFESVAKKVGFSKLRGLGGVMLYSVDTDDFLGDCTGGYQNNYILLKTIDDIFNTTYEPVVVCGGSTTAGPITTTAGPTTRRTFRPTVGPANSTTAGPTTRRTFRPTVGPANSTTAGPTNFTTTGPTIEPTNSTTTGPTVGPTNSTTTGPTVGPTNSTTNGPTVGPNNSTTTGSTVGPTNSSSTTTGPTVGPTDFTTTGPTVGPTNFTTAGPTVGPTNFTTTGPTVGPTNFTTTGSTVEPTNSTTTEPATRRTWRPRVGPI